VLSEIGFVLSETTLTTKSALPFLAKHPGHSGFGCLHGDTRHFEDPRGFLDRPSLDGDEPERIP
jgi:hypothetical protein